MGISNYTKDSTERTKESTVGLSGYTKFIGSGNKIQISNGAMNVNGEALYKAFNKYNSSFWKEDIMHKLLEEEKMNKNLRNDIKEIYGLDLESFAAVLGDEEGFKQTFLLPNYKPNIIINEINSLMLDLQELKDAGDNMTESQFRNSINRINERKDRLSESKLELILTECVASENKNFLFRALVNKFYDFGVYHSAISLDGTIIEWGRGPCGQSLICPTLDIKKLLFAFEIKAKEEQNFFEYIWNKIKDAGAFILNLFSGGAYGRWSIGRANDKMLNKIAKVCVQYNRSKYYNPLTNNCQHFVKKILTEIESDFSFDGEFGRIIRELENTGKVNFIFEGHTFNTRKELDDFVININFHNLRKNDKKLLICYKNTFDLYLRASDSKDEKFKTTKEAQDYWNKLISEEQKELFEK